MTVYFAVARSQPEGPIKIGVSIDVQRRQQNLSGGIPGGVSILTTIAGGKDAEGYIHELFAADRISGEWFRPSEALRQFIQDAHNGVPGLIPFRDPTAGYRRSPAEIAEDCIAQAKEVLAFLLGREFRGPGDTIDAALYRLEQKTGIPRSMAGRVRHRAMTDMLVSNYFTIKEAYDAAISREDGRALLLARPKDGATE